MAAPAPAWIRQGISPSSLGTRVQKAPMRLNSGLECQGRYAGTYDWTGIELDRMRFLTLRVTRTVHAVPGLCALFRLIVSGLCGNVADNGRNFPFGSSF